MNLSAVGAKAASTGRIFMKRHGPAVLTGAGIVGFTASAVLVGRAVLRAQDTVDHIQVNRKHIAEKEITEDYTKNAQAKEMGDLFIKGGAQVLKIYAPAIIVFSASTACILSAHGMMRRQQTALVAAYATLDAGFRAYRKRVEDELGKEKELDFYRGVRRVESSDESGEVCVINEQDDSVPSAYTAWFDETSPRWVKTSEYNKVFLQSEQQYANDQLRAHGYVFLNDILSSLGLKKTQAGQVVGWVLDGDGDGYVDFGIFDIGNPCARAFINGEENVVLLDFNVDGVILHKIG